MKGLKLYQLFRRGSRAASFLLCFLFSGFVFFHVAAGAVHADEQPADPKVRSTDVTAIVSPRGCPPYPGLVSPINNALLTSGVVAFKWTKLVGPAANSRYELYLNGTVKFGQIHTTNQETDDYTLTLNEQDGVYTLQLHPDKWLPDGVYTWKIRVIDVNNCGSDSTTWTFTVDSTAPNILITKIDGKDTAISALDPSTIPPEPIVVTHRRPTIEGQTEAGADVQLTVTTATGGVTHYRTTADGNGFFTFTLGSLPVNVPVTLTFIAIDAAGNSRVLDGIRLIYSPRVIIIPIPPIIPHPAGLTISIIIPSPPTLPEIIAMIFPPLPGPLPLPIAQASPVQPEIVAFVAWPWFTLLLLLLFLYMLAIFLITQNIWSSFLGFLWSLWHFWIFGFGGKHEWREEKNRELLPFFAFQLQRLDDKKHFWQQTLFTGPDGRWRLPKMTSDQIGTLASKNKRFQYPAKSLTVSDVRLGKQRRLYLSGESFVLLDSRQSKLQTSAECFVLPEHLEFTFVAWAVRKTTTARWKGWIWLPRIIIIAALILDFWILWHVKNWLSIGLLVLALLIFVRDLQARFHERMKVYVHG